MIKCLDHECSTLNLEQSSKEVLKILCNKDCLRAIIKSKASVLSNLSSKRTDLCEKKRKIHDLGHEKPQRVRDKWDEYRIKQSIER